MIKRVEKQQISSKQNHSRQSYDVIDLKNYKNCDHEAENPPRLRF